MSVLSDETQNPATPSNPLRPGIGTVEVRSALVFYFMPGVLTLVGTAAGWITPDLFPVVGMVFGFLATGHGTIILSRTKLKIDALKSQAARSL